MSIIRGKRPDANWYALDKKISEDQRLSWAARGLLVFLLGKPNAWKVSVEHLRKQTVGARISTGRDGVYALLAELKDAGYLSAARKRDEAGKLGEIDYVVSETPHPAAPHLAEPCLAQPDTAQTTGVKTQRAPKTEKASKTEKTSKTEDEQGGALPRTPELSAVDWPVAFDLDPQIVEDFRQHRRELRSPLTATAWKHILTQLDDLHAKGIDLNEALSVAMAMGYAMPVDPTRGKAAKISRRQEAQNHQNDRDVRWVHRNLPPGTHGTRPDQRQ